MYVADFFCGAGGFTEGFRQAGYKIVFAVDKWEPAVNTYKANKPNTMVIQDDVIRISKLPDAEFDKLVPDTEIIIGSPPCVAFSNSNKSGNGDKALGLSLLTAYFRIIARKKFKKNSILRYWVLENVPNIKNYIKDQYSAKDLGLPGNFKFYPYGKGKHFDKDKNILNAKNYGAPTNRKRFLCGEFPAPVQTHNDHQVIPLKRVLESLGEPCLGDREFITDFNYPGLTLPINKVSDHQYKYILQSFEWEKVKRLKQDKGYMGKMSFPEDINKPARTVMATMSSSSRESMILGSQNEYRLPTVREVASMMSFPIDYKFCGNSKGLKYTLVGNAVPPKLSYAIAVAILAENNIPIPSEYPRIEHFFENDFYDLNYSRIPKKQEKAKKDNAKFKYHIPYLIIRSFRVELTNYNSQFDTKSYVWNAEIHFSQGKDKARKYQPLLSSSLWSEDLNRSIDLFIVSKNDYLCRSFNEFQKIYCMTSVDRSAQQYYGPYELLESIKSFINDNLIEEDKGHLIQITKEFPLFPKAILLGYYVLSRTLESMM